MIPKECQTTGKDCLSRNEAEKVKLNMLKHSNRRIAVYECDGCFCYHVTSRKKHLTERNIHFK